jgi:hypothetical protein
VRARGWLLGHAGLTWKRLHRRARHLLPGPPTESLRAPSPSTQSLTFGPTGQVWTWSSPVCLMRRPRARRISRPPWLTWAGGLLRWVIVWVLGTSPHGYICERLGHARPDVKRRERGRHTEGERSEDAAGNPRSSSATTGIVAPRALAGSSVVACSPNRVEVAGPTLNFATPPLLR